jgi:hypothetical protein
LKGGFVSVLSKLFPSVPKAGAEQWLASNTPHKINIGCGFDKRHGYLNLDSDPACSPDLLVQDHDLYFLPRNHFEEVFAKDVLEHIPRAFMMNALFDWASLLKIGGELFVQTSWIYGIIDTMRAAGTFEQIHNWKVCLFGNQVHPGDWHHNGFTEETLRVYLAAVGLEDNGFTIDEGWLIATCAKKTDDWNHLLEIGDYPLFLTESYNLFLQRDPEEGRIQANRPTVAGSKERYHELRYIVGCAERLYKLGKAIEARG